MRQDKQTRLIALALSLTVAVVCTIMILGIQINFNQNDEGVKISTPLITIGLVAILFIYKFFKKQSRTSFVIKYADSKGKKISPYFTIAFTYFDYMLWCGILSCLCGILSGILETLYEKMVFDSILSWSYGLEKMAIVFAIYVLCLVIYTVGNMIAFSQSQKCGKREEVTSERN